MRFGRVLPLVLAAGLPIGAGASDAPHDRSSPAATDCKSCHALHNAQSAALTTTAGNANLCDSCHSLSTNFGFPWNAAEQAVPGASGTSHRWDATATNLGATAPAAGTEMGRGLVGGKLQCSTCHDQHAGANRFRGTQHASVTPGTNVIRSGGTGTGTLKLNAPAAAAKAAGYRVRIGPTATTFQISRDRGTTFLGWDGTAWVAGNASGRAITDLTSNPTLDDGTNVSVNFAGTFLVGDAWDFYVSYPFLRVSNAGGAMCTTCHKDRDMKYQDVEGGSANGVPGGALGPVTLGTTVFHHPTDQALNTKSGGIDRAAPLDANGAVQGSAGKDIVVSNDLTFDAGSVTCLSCHHPHNADSNSLTEDPR